MFPLVPTGPMRRCVVKLYSGARHLVKMVGVSAPGLQVDDAGVAR